MMGSITMPIKAGIHKLIQAQALLQKLKNNGQLPSHLAGGALFRNRGVSHQHSATR
ncbi:MAG TPA: hypothetical protein VGB77_14915 [Abditibacteriaceae bacterium]|jgi:hypothetical protein